MWGVPMDRASASGAILEKEAKTRSGKKIENKTKQTPWF
jgi:hypothetical protein